MKKRITAIFLAALLFLSALSSCTPAPPLTEELPLLPPAPAAPYSESGVEHAASTLYSALDRTARAVLVTDTMTDTEREKTEARIRKFLSPLLSYLEDAVRAGEPRGISEADMQKAVTLLSGDRVLLETLFRAVQTGEGLPYTDILLLFNTLVRHFGVTAASYLVYDYAGLYCRYEAESRRRLYAENSYSYLLREAEMWEGYKESLRDIGEQSFASLLRASCAVAVLFGGNADLGMLRGLSEGEILLFLRTEGALLSRLSLSAADYTFLLSFTSYTADSYLLDGINAADEAIRYAESLTQLLPLLGRVLLRLENSDVTGLRTENISDFLYALVHRMTREEFEGFLSLLDGERPLASYTPFLEAKRLYAEYVALAPSDALLTPDMLWQAPSSEFLEKYKQYVNQASPIFGFLLQKDLERSAE